MKDYAEEVEVEVDDERLGTVLAIVFVEAGEFDASFTHQFGVKSETGIEIHGTTILRILDENENPVDLPHLHEQITNKAEWKVISEWLNLNN